MHNDSELLPAMQNHSSDMMPMAMAMVRCPNWGAAAIGLPLPANIALRAARAFRWAVGLVEVVRALVGRARSEALRAPKRGDGDARAMTPCR